MGERLAPSLWGRRTSRPSMGARPNRAKSPWLIPLTGYGCSSDQPLNHSSILLPNRPEIGRGLRGPPSSLSLRNCHFACHASSDAVSERGAIGDLPSEWVHVFWLKPVEARVLRHTRCTKNYDTPGVPRITVHLGVPKNYGTPGVPSITVHLGVRCAV